MIEYKKPFISLVTTLSICFQFAVAQNLITGRVIDSETGKYIANVSITKVGTDFKTTTNALGFFQIEVTDSAKLELSCDGYIQMKVQISGKESVKIGMKKRQYFQGAPLQEPPEYPGGMPAYFEFIAKNVKAPPGAPKGTVIVRILIDPEGNVIQDSVKIIQSLSKACDREVLRVMKKMPKWNPGEGEANMPVMVPITFK